MFNGRSVGAFGVIHPDVLEAFGVAFPVSALELNLEPFCFDQNGRPLLGDLTSDILVS
jgi:phenylalanyl-tRNA synthetase beta chain